MKVHDDDGNEYEITKSGDGYKVKKISSSSWLAVVWLISMLLAFSNFQWNGIYIFGDVAFVLPFYLAMKLVEEILKGFNLGEKNDKGEFVHASGFFLWFIIYGGGFLIIFVVLRMIFSSLGIMVNG